MAFDAIDTGSAQCHLPMLDGCHRSLAKQAVVLHPYAITDAKIDFVSFVDAQRRAGIQMHRDPVASTFDSSLLDFISDDGARDRTANCRYGIACTTAHLVADHPA